MNCDCYGIEFRIPTYLVASFPNPPRAELCLRKDMDLPKHRQAGLAEKQRLFFRDGRLHVMLYFEGLGFWIPYL
jgi:hypothetical protein